MRGFWAPLHDKAILSYFDAETFGNSPKGIDTLTSNVPAHVLVWAVKPISYARHRFPPDVIRHSVWLYLRFTLSYRDVEDLLAERGLTVSNESIRRWSASSTTRTKDAMLQISQVCSALRFGPRGGLQHVQCSTALDQSVDAAKVSNRCTSILERCDSCGSIN